MVDTKHKLTFLGKLTKLQGLSYTLVGEYLGGKTKTTFRHEVCGYEWETAPQNVLRLTSCPRCSGIIKLTTADFIKEVLAATGDEYVVLGEYINAKTPIKILHTTCGKTSLQAPTDFKSGKRCGYCAGKRVDTAQIKDRIFDLVGAEYTVIGEYINCTTPIEVRHETCGNTYSVNFYDFSDGARCWECWKKSQTKTTQWFTKEVHKYCGDEYTVVGEYTRAKEHIKMRHESCNHEWLVTPDSFLRRKSRCPRCVYSKGELAVEKILDKKHITYTREHKFEGCKHKRLLPFDFYIPSINLCIEYDGKQHYSPVNFGGITNERAAANYKVTAKRDSIKTRFCDLNSIGLLRIPYYFTEEEIEDTITKAIVNREVMQEDHHQNDGL